MTDRWHDASDADGAFPSEWLAQCARAEAEACTDEPRWTHPTRIEEATFSLWLGIFERGHHPLRHSFRITHKRTLRCRVYTEDMGALVTTANGREVDGLDAFALVSCAAVRKLLAPLPSAR
jgi:hypothetical protein